MPFFQAFIMYSPSLALPLGLISADCVRMRLTTRWYVSCHCPFPRAHVKVLFLILLRVREYHTSERASSALLLRARLLKLRFQLHRKVVARVVVVPALLPQVRGAGL